MSAPNLQFSNNNTVNGVFLFGPNIVQVLFQGKTAYYNL